MSSIRGEWRARGAHGALVSRHDKSADALRHRQPSSWRLRRPFRDLFVVVIDKSAFLSVV